jgi:hypothetical protein
VAALPALRADGSVQGIAAEVDRDDLEHVRAFGLAADAVRRRSPIVALRCLRALVGESVPQLQESR